MADAAAIGNIQDDVKRDLAWLADRTPCDWMILDRADLARIFIAYGRLCPNDATWLEGPACPHCTYVYEPPSVAPLTTASRANYTVLSLEDVSHARAKRFAAHILIQPGLPRDAIASLIGQAVQSIRRSDYSRNELVERAHGGRAADVVLLFVYEDITQRPSANWIARALWISTSPTDARPATFGVQTADPELWLDWNQSYDAMAAFMASHQAEKGPYLRQLDAFVAGASRVTDQARLRLEQLGP